MEDSYEVLENITMEEDEETDIYSDACENYCRLQRTVTFLTNDGRVTEEWMEEHRLHILKYRELFINFSEIHEEIIDDDFRKTARQAEVLLANLVQSIQANRFFNTRFYLMLNEHMLKLCQYIFTEDELGLCMSKLSI
jgi:hypothetical protein